MAYGQVEIVGARKLRSGLRAAGDDLLDMRRAHGLAAVIAARKAYDLAPRKSGALRDTIRGAGTKTAAIIRAGTARVPYPPPIHWGWGRRHIAANPFLTRGAQRSESRWFPVYENYVNTALNKIKGA